MQGIIEGVVLAIIAVAGTGVGLRCQINPEQDLV
jgi:hypothetical protein